jgi:hypothetical protein
MPWSSILQLRKRQKGINCSWIWNDGMDYDNLTRGHESHEWEKIQVSKTGNSKNSTPKVKITLVNHFSVI